jgi:parallel beta-helix repeat protein
MKKIYSVWILVLITAVVITIAIATTVINENEVSTPSVSSDNISNILYVEPGNAADIQTKIDLCPSSGCKVIIPPGDYEISNTIQIPDDVTLQGSGIMTTIRLADNANVDMINNSNQETEQWNIEIRDLTLDGNRANNVGDIDVIHWEYCMHCKAVNLRILNSEYRGIYLGNHEGSNNIVENCFINNSNHSGIFLSSGTQNIIKNNVLSKNGLHGLYIDGDDFNTIENNIFLQNTENGIYSKGHDNIITNQI